VATWSPRRSWAAGLRLTCDEVHDLRGLTGGESLAGAGQEHGDLQQADHFGAMSRRVSSPSAPLVGAIVTRAVSGEFLAATRVVSAVDSQESEINLFSRELIPEVTIKISRFISYLLYRDKP
jgi:hypothetical protein